MAELEQVVVLLYVELIVLPELCGTFGGNSLYLFPFVLECFELIEVLVGFFGRGGELLDAFQNFELALEVVLLLLLQSFLNSCTTFANGLHGFAESWFCRVNLGHELVLFATCLYEGLEGFLHFGIVELVEELLQEVEFRSVAKLVASGYFLDAGHDFFLCLEGLLHDCLFGLVFNDRLFAFFGHRCASLFGHRGAFLFNGCHFRFRYLFNYVFYCLFGSNLRRLLKGSGL